MRKGKSAATKTASKSAQAPARKADAKTAKPKAMSAKTSVRNAKPVAKRPAKSSQNQAAAKPQALPMPKSANSAVAVHAITKAASKRNVALDAVPAMKVAHNASMTDPSAASWLAVWKPAALNLDAGSMKSAVDSQVRLYQAMFRLSPIGAMLQGQAMMTELVLKTFRAQSQAFTRPAK